jgi:hypothetical protein
MIYQRTRRVRHKRASPHLRCGDRNEHRVCEKGTREYLPVLVCRSLAACEDTSSASWQKRVAGAPLDARARSVIRFLLGRNISYRRSRCVDSLIRGDKYRAAIHHLNKQLARATAKRDEKQTRRGEKAGVARKRGRDEGQDGTDAVLSAGIRWAPSRRERDIHRYRGGSAE